MRNPGGYGNHQRVMGKVGMQLFQNDRHRLWLYREHKDLTGVCQIPGIEAGLNGVGSTQVFHATRARIKNLDLLGRKERCGHKPFDHGFAHVSTTNESNFDIFEHRLTPL